MYRARILVARARQDFVILVALGEDERFSDHRRTVEEIERHEECE